MANLQNPDKQLIEIKQALDLLVIVELCKSGATRDEIRNVVGNLDNNLFAKVNKIISKKKT